MRLAFGALPARVTAGSTAASTVSILDDDDPAVTVSFGAAAYTAAEGSSVTVRVTLSEDPERTVEIPLIRTNAGGATGADYSGVPDSVTFNSGETEQTFNFTATDDTEDDDGESVRLAFGALPARVTAGSTAASTVSILDDDDPAVTVSFEQAAYTAAEGGSVTVRVTLSADPERTVEIPLTRSNEGGATAADYSGVPDSVAFASGDTEQTFTFTATDDAEDDDDESVRLAFGALPARVTAGSTATGTVSITDDDEPSVTVSFEQAAYTVAEGSSVTVRVTLSADPERTVEIPLTRTGQDGATGADYSVPASVTFASGETEQSFTFTAVQDTVDDDGESVRLAFGVLPTGVSAGNNEAATVSITDDDVSSVTVSFDSATYSATEGGPDAEVTVRLSAPTPRQVDIPLTAEGHYKATPDDWSGVPIVLNFSTGDTSQMLLWMSSCGTGHSGGVPQDREDFASDIALETTYDLGLAHALPGAAVHVVPGSEVMTEPDQNEAIESRISLPVATPVQPMPVGLAGGGRYWTHPAQRGEGGLGMQPFGVAPGSDQDGRRRVRSYAEDADQGRGCHPGEPFQFGPQIADLPVELKVAACEGPQGVLGRRCGIL